MMLRHPQAERAPPAPEVEHIHAIRHARALDGRIQSLALHMQRLRAGDFDAQPAPDPSVDVINMDEVTKASLENFPVEWTRKPDEVANVRQTRQAQADQAKREQELAFAAKTAASTNPEQYRQLKQDMQDMQAGAQ